MNAVCQACLVDDTADYRLLVGAIFERYLPAYSLRSFELDQHMPLLSGYLTLVARQQALYRFIPVVMMSADASHSKINSFYEAGARSFLAKSTNFTTLTETLVAACQFASKLQ